VAKGRLVLIGAALAGVLTCLSDRSDAGTPGHLYCVGSTKNANVVCYDVRLRKDGKIDTARPLDAYWLMRAEAGQREEISFFERKFGYGTTLVGSASAAGFRFKMNVLPSRTIEVSRVNGGFRAKMTVAGKPAWLVGMHAQVKPGWIVPKVSYVTVRGVDPETGRECVERIKNL
jgi:hypothetical protein